MYTINLLGGTSVRADFDEIQKIVHSDGGLIVLRSGIINPKHITTIVLNEDAEAEMMREPGETEEQVQKRLRNYKSENIFPQLKETKQLS